jgi:hypothetical protein
MLKAKKLIIFLTLTILLLTLTRTRFHNSAKAEAESAFPTLAMPKEYVNYTITQVNGVLWAKIDGMYPIYLTSQPGSALPDTLPMVYPTPPGTTNISIKLDDKNLGFGNYSEAYPLALHHTAIGDWTMIICDLSPVSSFFVLKIHYEHPVQIVNGSYLFLYDLNISPYLSAANNNSTAYFTIHMENNASNLQAYTAKTDTEWNQINFTSQKEGSTQTISIVMYSEYLKPLLGDLVVEFNDSNQVPEYPFWAIMAIAVGFTFVGLVYVKKKRSVAC